MQNQYEQCTQQELRNLYKTTGSLLLLDIPEGLQFGIDNIIWKIGQKFKGIKFIPLGCHIISYTLKSQNNMFKINKFLFFDQTKGPQNQIIIMKWSNKYSMFLQMKGSDAQGYRQGVRNYHFDSYLGPYPKQNYEFWRQNTSHITKCVLQKLDPIQKIYKFEEEYNKIKEQKALGQQLKIDVDEDQDDEEEQVHNEQQINGEENKQQMPKIQKIQEQQQQNQLNMNNQTPKNGKQRKDASQNKMNTKFQQLSDTIYYSQIPRILINDPSHINKINIDKTQILIEVITKEYLHQTTVSSKSADNDSQKIIGIMGEIQYSFVYFLIGEDQQSFKQWKKLINLMTFSEDLYASKQILKLRSVQIHQNKHKKYIIQNMENLGRQFIMVFYNQLKQFPVDFFVDQLSKDSFIKNCLQRLKQYYQEVEGTINKKIKKRLQKLFKLLDTKFNYQVNQQISQTVDQNAPVIVQQNQSYF